MASSISLAQGNARGGHKTFKWIVHCLSGKSEIERITESERCYTNRMAKGVSSSILRTTKMINVRNLVFIGDDSDAYPVFDIECVTTMIADHKKISRRSESIPRLETCLSNILTANVYLQALHKIRRRRFSHETDTLLLERFWRGLYPSKKRSSDADWQLVGFQGPKPWTDLRGPGMLGLTCMVEFVEASSDDARRIHSTFKELSFAITIVNVVAVTMELFESRQFDDMFYGQDLETKNQIKSVALSIFQRKFVEVMNSFIHTWAGTNRNVMDFNIVLQSLKSRLLLGRP
mmetsp:Transcript_9424/g.17765  ORF Transcript_9424/g.17765 Transcript_9424/m.17765 type:complete len:290 (+) Transcript_9424:1294-2163(+)